jgi:hypothetical protein
MRVRGAAAAWRGDGGRGGQGTLQEITTIHLFTLIEPRRTRRVNPALTPSTALRPCRAASISDVAQATPDSVEG